MEIFVVGGAVRDVLLGKEPKDMDFCVVGSTSEEMLDFGFKPIEATSFPVFHDKDGQEYALARKELKTGDGYHGFECEYDLTITLEEDLFRRDLTMNSMAVPVEKWNMFKETKDVSLLIDPYNGLKSINNKKVKHTSKHFTEDPVRALRAVRLANRYKFDISKSTVNLIELMVESGDLNHLTAERVWLELTKVFEQSDNISSFFNLLDSLGITDVILPTFENEQLFIDHNDLKEYNCSDIDDIRYAFVATFNVNSLQKIKFLCKKLTVPNTFLKLFKAINTVEFFFNDDDYRNPTLILDVLIEVNAYKVNSLLEDTLKYFEKIAKNNIVQCTMLRQCHKLTENIGIHDLSKKQLKTLKGKEIGKAIDAVKIKIIEEYLN